MKKLIFSATGFPADIKTLQTLQDNTLNAVKGFARQHENYTVLYGMELNPAGTVISAGAFVFNGEIIPFLESTVGETITINEVIEYGDYNTNPTSNLSTENLPTYSFKSAQVGTGGVHTFSTNQLKRYVNERVIAQGVVEDADIWWGDIPSTGALVIVNIPEQSEPFRIEYTLRSQGTVSQIAVHSHMIIDSTSNNFRVAISGAKFPNRTYSLEWKILKA